MTEERIERINELYRKSKTEGLTDAEKQEQQILRKEFIDAMDIARFVTQDLSTISCVFLAA